LNATAPPAAPTGAPSVAAAPAPAAADREHPVADRPADLHRRAALVAAAAPTATGTLTVHAVYAPDRVPAQGLLVQVQQLTADPRLCLCRAHTDQDGNAQLSPLAAGRYEVWTIGNSRARATCEVRGGQASECELLLPPGIDIDGVVVDAAGVPIGGAE